MNILGASNFSNKELEGNWISQKNIYFLNTKKQYKYQETLSIIRNDNSAQFHKSLLSRYNLYDCLQQNQKHIIYSNFNIYQKYILKEKHQTILKYEIVNISNKLLRIQFKVRENNYFYSESFYSVNKNLKISIGLLKQSNKYIATILTSYIKRTNRTIKLL